MAVITYNGLINQSMDLYRQGNYSSAYDLITKKGGEVNGIEAQVYNFRYSLACRMDQNDLALRIMEEAIVDRGYWYSYDYFIGDDDLKPLHGRQEFDRFAGICRDREAQAKKNSRPEIEVLTPKGQGKKSLLIALHGNQGNIRVTRPYWEPCLSHEYILALPQSSLIEFSDAYAWKDIEKGANELKAHYDNMLRSYDVDANNIVVGGFSAGCRVALYAMLHDMIDAKSFIFVGPWLPEVDVWKDGLDSLKAKGIDGHIFCGDRDDDCFELAKKFVSGLNEKNIKNTFKIIQGLSHDFPDNFKDELDHILSHYQNDTNQ